MAGKKLTGEVALITGAARGIGKAYADYLLAENVKVVIADININVGEETKKELAKKYGEDKVSFVHCDVTKKEQFEDAIKETIRIFGKLDILINNAGIFDEFEPGWMKTIDINFTSLVRGTLLGVKYMDKSEGNNGGTIVNIASLTTFTPFACVPVYSATKAAVYQFSRSLGSQFHYDRTGVRIITIHPGLTDTEILQGYSERMPSSYVPSFEEMVLSEKYQSVTNMGKGLIQILQQADSGTMWSIGDENPPKRVDFIVEYYEK